MQGLKSFKQSKFANKLKSIIYVLVYIVYDIITSLVKLNFRKKSTIQRLLIIRVDEIGDYMLWRSFLKEIRTAGKFKNYEIHFCGNSNWKSIFNLFEAEYVSNIIWLDKQLFRNSLVYRYRFLKSIYRQNYEIIINTTFARDRINDDTIVNAASARQVFGMEGNVKKNKAGHNEKLYSSLFTLKEKPIFEFTRNKKFTEFITSQTANIENTQVPYDKLPPYSTKLPTGYFVVFPGARNSSRIWPTENFVEVSNYLYNLTGHIAIVCGANGDTAYTSSFCASYKNPYIDLTSKTTLPEMLTILKNAKCLFSVDTGAVHLAAAVGCPVFGIFNGTYYGRFAPYPKQIAANFFAVYPDEIENDLKNGEIVKTRYEFSSDFPYSKVPTQKVIDKIKANLQLLN